MDVDPATIRGRTWFIQAAQDLCRAIDYLATRPDIDSQRLTFAGLSFGGSIGPVLLVAEPRFKAAVFVAGGYQPLAWLPEVDSRRYAPHVKVPVLMVNGSSDAIFPVKSSQLPLFRHLGSADKQHKLLPTSHVVPADKAVAIIDEWLKARPGPERPPNSK